jgi:hypothetical protein
LREGEGMENQQPQFMDLAEYRRADVPRRVRGNIIKSTQVFLGGTQQIGQAAGESDDPVVLLHREGERITSAEFVCRCGRCAILNLEYAQE